jgi:hypothetical protein
MRELEMAGTNWTCPKAAVVPPNKAMALFLWYHDVVLQTAMRNMFRAKYPCLWLTAVSEQVLSLYSVGPFMIKGKDE